jgi:hypothetical protein
MRASSEMDQPHNRGRLAKKIIAWYFFYTTWDRTHICGYGRRVQVSSFLHLTIGFLQFNHNQNQTHCGYCCIISEFDFDIKQLNTCAFLFLISTKLLPQNYWETTLKSRRIFCCGGLLVSQKWTLQKFRPQLFCEWIGASINCSSSLQRLFIWTSQQRFMVLHIELFGSSGMDSVWTSLQEMERSVAGMLEERISQDISRWSSRTTTAWWLWYVYFLCPLLHHHWEIHLSSTCCLCDACMLPLCCLYVACMLPLCCLYVACMLPLCCLVSLY